LEMVSRDRGGDYASAATQAAPQAVQVADRFHVFKNVSEAVELALTRCRAEIRKKAEDAVSDQVNQQFQAIPEETPEAVLPEMWKPIPGANKERERLVRREQRHDRYQQAIELQSKGLTRIEIAQRTGLSERTLRRWLNADTFPEARRRRKRPSEFDKYGPYVLQRWEDGCRNGTQLLQEAKALGYSGSYTSFSRFLKTLREKREEQPCYPKPQKLQNSRPVCVPSHPLQHFTAHEALWLFVREPAVLDEKEKEVLSVLRQLSETANTLYQLVQEFRHLLHAREGAKLDNWLEKAKASHIPEWLRFVRGVEFDKAAVVAGLTYPQSNGLVEGHVNKLKLIKRMGYGRAAFPLLRQRVLHAL
jgi:transposase